MQYLDKISLFLISWCLFAFETQAQINFSDSSWEASKALARESKKFIFVDAYAEWCGPCKWMEKEIFTNQKVADFYNQNFVSYKADMEKEIHKTLRKSFSIKSYPTFLYFNDKGEIAHKVVGSLNAENLIKHGKIALNPKEGFYRLKKRYQAGERDTSFLYNYTVNLRQAEEDYQKVCEEYFKQINFKDWTNDEKWRFIRQHINTIFSEVFQKIVQKKAVFDSIIGKEVTFHFIKRVTQNSFQKVISAQDSSQLTTLKSRITELYGDSASTYIAKLEYEFYAKDKALYIKYAESYLDNYCKDWSELNQMAWHLYENEKDEESLKKALRWAKRSVEMERNFYNTDTYAHLLYHFGKFREALALARESLALGKEIDEDLKASEDLIQKIEDTQY